MKSDHSIFDRVNVPGGWIYRQILTDERGGVSAAIAFVPEPQPPSEYQIAAAANILRQCFGTPPINISFGEIAVMVHNAMQAKK